MGEYIDWSARDCDASCAGQIIQSTIEVSQSAQIAVNSVAEAQIALESVREMINEMQLLSDNTESQVIQLRIDVQQISDDVQQISGDVQQLSDDVNYLTSSINNSIPIIDDNLLELITIILIAFIICTVACLLLIGYSNFLENKKYRNRRITVQNNN